MDSKELHVTNYDSLNTTYHLLETESTAYSRCGRFCTVRFCNAVQAAAVTLAVEIVASAIFTSQVILPELQKRGIPIDYKLGLGIGIPLFMAIAAIVGSCAYCNPGITKLEGASQNLII